MTILPAGVAVAAAGLAVALLLPAPGRPRGARPRAGAARRLWPLLGAGAPVLVLVLGGPPSTLVLAAIGGAAGAGGVALVRARSRRLDAHRTAARVLEACEQLTGELVAGQPPGTALERTALAWPPLAPVAEAFRVGADVPEAWRVLAARPGAHDLRLVGAAWQVAHRTGRGLADTLDHVTRSLRATSATRRVVDGELASARATAKLIAVLPLLALVMGSGAGGDPWGFLLRQPVGLACLALGLAFATAGLAWIEALARGVHRA